MSSVVSCWNFLYSTLGHGTLAPVSVEEALELVGFKPPYFGVKFGTFTSNKLLIEYFTKLNEKFGVSGSAHIFYKPSGREDTTSQSSDEALMSLKEGLS